MRFNKEQRKAQILEVATNIFVERGYHYTKTKDIARACGISEPVIYKHFKGKDELFLAVMASIAGETFQEITFNGRDDTEYILYSFIMNRVETVEMNFHLFKRLLSELLENEAIRRYYFEKYLPRLAYPVMGYIEQLQHDEKIRKDISPLVITLALAGIFVMVALAKNLDSDSAFSDLSSKDISSQMVQIYLHGLLKSSHPKGEETCQQQ